MSAPDDRMGIYFTVVFGAFVAVVASLVCAIIYFLLW